MCCWRISTIATGRRTRTGRPVAWAPRVVEHHSVQSGGRAALPHTLASDIDEISKHSGTTRNPGTSASAERRQNQCGLRPAAAGNAPARTADSSSGLQSRPCQLTNREWSETVGLERGLIPRQENGAVPVFRHPYPYPFHDKCGRSVFPCGRL